MHWIGERCCNRSRCSEWSFSFIRAISIRYHINHYFCVGIFLISGIQVEQWELILIDWNANGGGGVLVPCYSWWSYM